MDGPKLFRVYNGYTGFSAVHRVVMAKDRATALGLAKSYFAQWSDMAEAVEICFDDLGVELEEQD